MDCQSWLTAAGRKRKEKEGNARKCIMLRIGLGMYQFFMMFWYLLIIFTFLSTGVASADFKVVTDWPQGSSVGQLWGQLSLCSGEIHAGASYFPSSLLWVWCVQCRPSHIILLIITRYMNDHWPIWTLLDNANDLQFGTACTYPYNSNPTYARIIISYTLFLDVCGCEGLM